MKRKRNHLVNLCLALIVASAAILLSDTVFFRRVELLNSDTFFRLRSNPRPSSQDIVIVEITDDDIAMAGRWPWERSWLVKMAKALKAFEVKDVLFDFLLSEPSQGQDDINLQRAMQETGNIYLPTFFRGSEWSAGSVIAPIDALAKYAKGTGFANLTADIDGNFRKFPLYLKEKDTVYHSIVLKMAMDRLSLKIKAMRPHELALSDPDQGHDLRIPVVDGNMMLINWYGKWETTFRRYSSLEVLRAYEDVSEGREPAIDLQPLKNRTCIVALTAVGLFDIRPVPVQSEYPGVGLIATSLNNILDRYFIRTVPGWINAAFIYAVSLIPLLLVFRERPSKEILSIAAALIVFLIPYCLFLKGYRMMSSTPLLTLLSSYIVLTAYNFITPKTLSKEVEVHKKTARRLKKRYKDLRENLEITTSQKEDLEKINRELGRFTHTVSHDIRSPLMGILGYADLLQKKIKNTLNTKEKKFLDGIIVSVDRLNAMIDGLLRSTKITRIRNPYEQVNFNELITAIEQRLEYEINHAQADLRVQQNLPDVICDRVKMEEVFHNLISNAIKFSSGGTIRPKIEIRYRDKDNVHEFNVKDNGIGIDPKDHTEIFRMFYRAGAPGHAKGTGVGLSIVQSIIHDHGGQVWVESQPAFGAAFFFTIPKDLNISSSQGEGDLR